MMSSITRIAVCIAALCAGVSVHSQETTREVPPGREFQQWKVLTTGLTDCWKLEVSAGEVLHCIVEAPEFDPVLTLVGNDGEVLAENDGEGSRSEIRRSVAIAGEVQLRIQGFEGRGGGRYSFWLARYTTTPQSATGETMGEFGSEQWRHVAIDLRAGEVLVPTVYGDGRLSAVFDFARGVAMPALLGGYQAQHDGAYHLRIEGAEGRRFRLRSTLARRRELSQPSQLEEAIPPQGFDSWTAHIDKGLVYRFDLAMPGRQLQMLLREQPNLDRAKAEQEGPSFKRLATIDKGGRRHQWVLALADAPLELLLRNTGEQEVPLQLAFAAASAEVAAPTPVEGRLELGSGQLYSLQAKTGQLIDLSLQSAHFDGAVQIFDPDGASLDIIDDAGPLERDPRHLLLIHRSGCYRLLVFAFGNGGSGSYALRTDLVEVPELGLGSSLTLELAAGGVRCAQLELQAGQEVWLSARSAKVDAGVSVIDPSGRGVGTWEGGGVDHNVLFAVRAAHSGRYTLQLHSRSGSGNCELRAILPR